MLVAVRLHADDRQEHAGSQGGEVREKGRVPGRRVVIEVVPGSGEPDHREQRSSTELEP
jgi:hypothetical protein